jgi:hypothetical protein
MLLVFGPKRTTECDCIERSETQFYRYTRRVSKEDAGVHRSISWTRLGDHSAAERRREDRCCD